MSTNIATRNVTQYYNIAMPTIELARQLRRVESSPHASRCRDYISSRIREELQWQARCAQEAVT